MRIFTLSILIMLICGCSSFELIAQGRNPVRIELNANLDMESYNLVPCGEKGLLVFFEDEAKGSGVDTNLIKSGPVPSLRLLASVFVLPTRPICTRSFGVFSGFKFSERFLRSSELRFMVCSSKGFN